MKFLMLFIVFISLFSCATKGSSNKDNVYIHFLNAEGNEKFAEKQRFIEEIVRDTIELCKTVYPLEEVDIVIRNKSADFLIIPYLGVGGMMVDENTIQIVMNIDFYNLEFMLNNNLKRTLLHELGHVIHYKNNQDDYTLFESILTEGIADHFEISLTGEAPQKWSINLSENEITKYMSLAKEEFWNTDYDHDKWFFNYNYTKWVGYSLGYKIIGDYLAKNPSKTIVDVMKLSDEEIYESLKL